MSGTAPPIARLPSLLRPGTDLTRRQGAVPAEDALKHKPQPPRRRLAALVCCVGKPLHASQPQAALGGRVERVLQEQAVGVGVDEAALVAGEDVELWGLEGRVSAGGSFRIAGSFELRGW